MSEKKKTEKHIKRNGKAAIAYLSRAAANKSRAIKRHEKAVARKAARKDSITAHGTARAKRRAEKFPMGRLAQILAQ